MGKTKKELAQEDFDSKLEENKITLREAQEAIAEGFGLNADDVEIDIESVILLDDILEECNKTIRGEIEDSELFDWIDEKIKIINYIDIDLKKSYVQIFYSSYSFEDNDFTDLAFAFELYSKLILMFTYTNIDFDLDRVTDKEYNIFMRSGFADYIINKIGRDYNEWIKMFERTVNMRSAFVLDAFNIAITDDTLSKNAKDMGKAFEGMSEEKLKYVMEIMQSNDPNLNELKNTLYDETVKVIEKQRTKES